MNFSFKNLSLPTPKKIKYYADVFLWITSITGGFSLLASFPKIAGLLATVGIIAKGFSQGYAEFPEENPKDNSNL